jgi:hypothetical protein
MVRMQVTEAIHQETVPSQLEAHTGRNLGVESVSKPCKWEVGHNSDGFKPQWW